MAGVSQHRRIDHGMKPRAPAADWSGAPSQTHGGTGLGAGCPFPAPSLPGIVQTAPPAQTASWARHLICAGPLGAAWMFSSPD